MSNKEASTFVAGLVSSGSAYNMTILTNHQGIEKILNRDQDFIDGILKKIIFESNKIDDRRENWNGHDFSKSGPRMEVKALTGWPFILNFSFSLKSMDLLGDKDAQSIEHFTNKLVSEINYLGRNFSLTPSETDIQVTPAQVAALSETVEPKEAKKSKSVPKKAAKKKAVAKKKAAPKKASVKKTVKAKEVLD